MPDKTPTSDTAPTTAAGNCKYAAVAAQPSTSSRSSYQRFLGNAFYRTINMTVKDHPPFVVHRAFLAKVPFFDACLGLGFEEGLTNKINLPDDNIDAFKDFLSYLYFGKSALYRYNDIHEREDQSGVLSVLDLYSLAEKYSYEQLQNDIMDLMVTIAKNAGYGAMRPEFLDKLEKSGRCMIPLHCQLRRLWCTSYAHMIKVQGLSNNDQEQALAWARGGGGRVAEVFKMLMSTEGLKHVARGTRCRWHMHSTTPSCISGDDCGVVKEETTAAT